MVVVQLEKIEIPPSGVHLTLNVKVNGINTKMVLDTGASRSVIDLDYLKDIIPDVELQEEEISSTGVGADNLQSFTFNLEKVKLGELTLEQFEIAVMDLSHVKASYRQIGEEEILGVIGGDILNEYTALIDYSELSLTLRPNH